MNKIIKKSIGFVFALVAFFGMTHASLALGPTMFTNAETNKTQTTVTLNGAWNAPGASSTDVRFEYGTTPAFGLATGYITQVNPTGSYTANITGLTPNTTYYYRAMGVNNFGVGFGAMGDFTTLSYSLPIAITSQETNVTGTSAMLNGGYNGNGLNTTTWFEYSNNSNFVGAYTTSKVNQNNTQGSVTPVLITGLTPNTTYYFRLVAETSGGITKSSTVLNFPTLSNGSSSSSSCYINSFSPNTNTITIGQSVTLSWVTTNCTNVNLTGVNGNLSINGSRVVYPTNNQAYTLTASNNNNTVSSVIIINVNQINNNSNNYWWNWFNNNSNSSFWNTNSNYVPPVNNNNVYVNNVQTIKAITSSVTDVDTTSAILNGFVYKNNQSYVNAYFEYGTSTTLNQNTSRLPLKNGNPVKFSNGITTLLPDTIYYFRIVASDGSYISKGDIYYFKTKKVGVLNAPVISGTISNTNNDSNIKSDTNNVNTVNEMDSVYDNSLAASAGFLGGFLPGTFIGWLLVFILILIIFLIVRSFNKKNEVHHVASH